MKEITYVLAGRIQDEKTGNYVDLWNVKVTGTPLQVGMIFDALKGLPGKLDVSVMTKADANIFDMGKDALEQARSQYSDSDYYDDPDRSDEGDKELARIRSHWRVHIYPTETE